MDFETISRKAYQREYIDGTSLEQLVWYKMKEVYQDYERGYYSIEESQIKKKTVENFYKKQLQSDNFWKSLHDERYKVIRESEEILQDILKAEQEKVSEKQLTKMLIEYIVKITGRVPIKTEYENNYEVK